MAEFWIVKLKYLLHKIEEFRKEKKKQIYKKLTSEIKERCNWKYKMENP